MLKPLKTTNELRELILSGLRARPETRDVGDVAVSWHERDAGGANWDVAWASVGGARKRDVMTVLHHVVPALRKKFDTSNPNRSN